MDEKERELRQQLAAKLDEARSLAAEGKLDEARAAKNEAQELRKQIDFLAELRDTDTPVVTSPVLEPEHREQDDKDKAAQYRSAFLKALRNKPLNAEERVLIDEGIEEIRAGMQGDVAEDGGLIVPQDISTQINEFKRQFVSLETYVTVEPVSTRSGSRVIEKNADITAFTEITELTDLTWTTRNLRPSNTTSRIGAESCQLVTACCRIRIKT
ncbi:hypothetical protein J6TS7_31660 [Paenibacillus dendritiformis]|nr:MULTISPECIES: phage major capsid protein [Paenibacillus]GIO79556.1 hypothetical protein J6TS7_31660 [Paenibacillus dendritiformis]